MRLPLSTTDQKPRGYSTGHGGPVDRCSRCRHFRPSADDRFFKPTCVRAWPMTIYGISRSGTCPQWERRL